MTMDQASSPERIPMHMIDLAHTLQATAALTAPGSRARPPGNARRRRGRSWLVGGAVALLLAAGGWLVFEIGASQRAAVQALLHQNGYTAVGAAADLAGLDRCVWGQVPG